MVTSTSPTIFAANIPSITALRNELDYGDPRLPRCAAFYDDTRAFRKKFITSRGIAGTELHDWKSGDGQAALTEMTLAYLDKEGNGLLFWPDDESSDKYNKYQYSKDHARIKRLVKQLFFRLNQQQFRNKKYKHKPGSDNKPGDGRGHSVATAIDVDAIEPPSILSPAGRDDGATIKSEPSPTGVPCFGRPHGEEPLGSPRVSLDDADVYAVPPSPPRMRQFASVNRPSTGKRGPTSGAQDRPVKRQKGKHQTSSGGNDGPSTVSATRTWTSPRVKRTIRREGYHGLDVMNQFIDLALVPDQEVDTPDLQPPDLTTITVKAPPEVTINDRPEPDASGPRGEAQQNAGLPVAAEARLSPHHGDRPCHQDDPRPHQALSDAAHSTPTAPHAEQAMQTGRASEQPKPPLLHASKSPTPGLTGTAGGGRGPGDSDFKFSIEFIYRVVLSRTPKTVTERWTPQGRFQDKTLAELRKELPFSDDGESRGLIFTIDSPCSTMIERILNDDEGGFLSLKGYINRDIREWLARQRRQGVQTAPRLLVDILIERMSDDEKKEELDGLGDLDLEW